MSTNQRPIFERQNVTSTNVFSSCDNVGMNTKQIRQKAEYQVVFTLMTLFNRRFWCREELRWAKLESINFVDMTNFLYTCDFQFQIKILEDT